MEGLSDLTHHLLLGDPAAAAASAVGLPEGLAKDMASAAPLPGDRRVASVVMLVRVTGVVVGIATGCHPLAVSSMKSIVHSVAGKVVAAGIRGVKVGDPLVERAMAETPLPQVASPPEPGRPVTPVPPPPRTEPPLDTRADPDSVIDLAQRAVDDTNEWLGGRIAPPGPERGPGTDRGMGAPGFN